MLSGVPGLARRGWSSCMLRNQLLSPALLSTGNSVFGTAAAAKGAVAGVMGAMLEINPDVPATSGARSSVLPPCIGADVPMPAEPALEWPLPFVDELAEFVLPPVGAPAPPEPTPAPPAEPRDPPPPPGPLTLPPALNPSVPIPTLADAPTAPAFAPAAAPMPLGPRLPLAEVPLPPLLRSAPTLSPPDPMPALTPAPRPAALPLTLTSSAATLSTCATITANDNRAAMEGGTAWAKWVRSLVRRRATVPSGCKMKQLRAGQVIA